MNQRNVITHLLAVTFLSLGFSACVTPETHEPETEASEAVRRVISAENAPAAVGPYSQAIQAGNMLFLAGQIGLDPATRTIVEGGIEAETRQVMSNLDAVLKAAGFSMSDVVQAQVFLADLNDYAVMNEIYGSYFPTMPPGRAAVQVARLPLDARIEIMMTAVKTN